VEQVVDSITNTAKNSEKEVIFHSFLHCSFCCKLETSFSDCFTTKASFKRLECLGKTSKITTGALYGPQIIMLKREDKSTTPNSYSSG
jgi:hypothetical protein